jgi:6-phosphofructokinase 1
MDSYEVTTLGSCTIDSPIRGVFTVSDDAVLVDPTRSGCAACQGQPPMIEMAGPRRRIFFEPSAVRAAIVTCGGLCPGLNDVVRALTMVLWHRYGVREILGLRYGYEGLNPAFGHPPLALTPDLVADIHYNGGTMLGSSRGYQDVDTQVQFLVDQRINLLFAIGGDGTQRGALDISQALQARRHPIAVIGVPKTIDNDISLTDRTFGFETAVAQSRYPIAAIHHEAKGMRNGIGLVKLMGRESGFIAAYAALASSDVNLVLVPEVPFSMEQVIDWLQERLARKSHAVIVVAEGAGQTFVPAEGADKSGNRKLGDIGLYLKAELPRRLAALGIEVGMKYVDPSYMIRSTAASADDSVFCFQLAENAVHAGMAGRTGMVVGIWNGHFVNVPIARAVAVRKCIDPRGALWQSVLNNTGQPF